MMQNAIANGQTPPPLPGFGFPPPFPPQTPQHAATPMTFPPPQPFHPPPAQPPVAASERIQEVMDSDREDGEVSEGEVVAHVPTGKVNGRAFQEPPRSVPQAKPASPRVEEAYNPDQPAAGQRTYKEPIQKQSKPATPPNPMDALQQNRDHAKQFIKLLHSNNIGYRTLAKEPLDLDQLRGLYQSLNLPSEPAPILPPKTNAAPPPAPAQTPATGTAVQPVSGGQIEQQKPTPTVKTNVSAGSVKATASPVDRKDYIARLQAAKLAKANAAQPSPPQKTPPAMAAPPAPAVKTIEPATTPTAKPPATQEQRARQTEMIRQRLEIIKAKNSNLALNGTAPAPSPSTAQQVQPASSGTTTPSTQTYKAPFPGIPGLFMNPPPTFDNSASTPTPSTTQKRPAPPDSAEASTPRGSVTPYTRPLGDSPHTYQDEPMLMEASEDESNGSDMDIDDDQAPSKPAVAPPSAEQQRQNPGMLAEFPSRPTSVLPASSVVSTPGAQTPSTQARELELKRKEDQLAAMRLTLKKKLAEKREKDKAAAAAAAAASTSSVVPQNPSTVVTALQNGTSAKPLTPMSGMQAQSVGFAASNDAMNDASELIRDVKRRRREEIQSKLPSFDTELAANTGKIAQLMKEMEMLRAQNEKIAEDKARLISELESLGVDTEGMSHAEMLAKKDEIEQEKTPEPEPSAGPTSTLHTSAPLEPSFIPTAGIAEDTAQVEKEPEAEALPVQSEVNDEHTSVPGFGHRPEQKLEHGTAPSQASTVDEVQASEAVPASGESLPLIVEDLSLPEGPRTSDLAPIASQTATPLDEEDDFYSPPAAEATLDDNMDLDNTLQAQVAADTASAKSPSEEGEVEMSLASDDEEEEYEPEYEPEEPTVITDAPVQEAQITEVETTKSVASDDVSTEDEEAYEPPDVDEELPDVQADEEVAAVDVAAPEVEAEADAEDGAMDIASSSSEDSDSDSESESDGEIASGNDETISANQGLQPATNIADDLAQELQPSSAPEAVRSPLDARTS